MKRRLRAWWKNSNYDRDQMERFYQEFPEWSGLPPEAVATSVHYGAFCTREALSDLRQVVKEEFKSWGPH